MTNKLNTESKRRPTLASNVTEHLLNQPMQMYLDHPAVSASLIKKLVEQCPLAAWHDSFLNPDRPPAYSNFAADMGTLVHEIVLEQTANSVRVIDPKDHAKKDGSPPSGWTTAAMREAREDAKAHGLIPVLPDDMSQAQQAANSIRRFIDSLDSSADSIKRAFADGHSESTLHFEHRDVALKCRPDRLAADASVIVDIKTTSTIAQPGAFSRQLYTTFGGHITASLYKLACRYVFGTDPRYLFLVCEMREPYLCSLVECDAAALQTGREQIEHALALWKQCLAQNRWPGYPNYVAEAEYPNWKLAEWERQQQLERIVEVA